MTRATIKLNIVLTALLLNVSLICQAEQAKGAEQLPQDKAFTLYLVRHAEKQKQSVDPDLTQCGRQRAEQLATMLSKVKLDAIYSTQYQRTIKTANPSAKQHQLEIQDYDPRALARFAKQLKRRQDNALIVGHSNTTPQLAALLSNSKVAPLTEQDYQYLYQLHIVGEQVNVNLLTQPLKCQ